MAASKRWYIYKTGVRCQVLDLWRFASLSVTFSRLCILWKDEQQMREGSERTRERDMGIWVLKGVGGVTRVIVQFPIWHPSCHVLTSILWCRTLPRGVSSLHKARRVGAIHYVYIYQSTDLPWVEPFSCVSWIWLVARLAVSTVTSDSCGGGRGSDCDVGLSSRRCSVTVTLGGGGNDRCRHVDSSGGVI